MAQKTLLRTIGFSTATSLVIGTIIGSGIFMRPAEMAALLGSPALMLLAWVISGLFTMLSVMVIAEIAAMLPEEGGIYTFMRHIYGDFWAYLYGWAAFAVINCAGTAGIAFIVAQYAEYFITLPRFSAAIEQSFVLQIPFVGKIYPLQQFGVKLLTMLTLTLFSVISYRSTKLGGELQVIITIAKVAAIVLLSGGLFFSGKGSLDNLFGNSSIIKPEGFAMLGAFVAACNGALQAFDGSNNMLFMTGEIKDPGKTIPRSLFVGLITCILVYSAINAALMYMMPVDDMANASLVASDAAQLAFGSIGGGLIAFLICFSVLGTTNSSVLTSPRMTFAMARDSLFFKAAAKIHPRFQTPGNAILIHWLVMIVLVLTGSFFILTDMYIFIVWVFNLMLMAGLFVLRKKMPDKHRPYKVWGYPWLPAIVILFNLFYLIITAADDISNYIDDKTPLMNSIFGIVVTAMGIPLFWYFRWRRKRGRDG